MRDRRFRAWHKTEGKMYYRVSFIPYGEGWTGGNPKYRYYQIHHRSGGFFLTNISEIEIIEFSGLTDRNGFEIYEDDICQIRTRKEYGHQSEGYAIVGKVEFGKICIRDDSLYDFDAFHINGRSIKYLLTQQLEVIGNIYENSDLLKLTR